MGRPHEALEVQEIYETIAELPQDFRDALVAIDVVGLSYREAARALGVREATVTTRLHRARRRVAERLVAPAQEAARGVAGAQDTRSPAGQVQVDERSSADTSARERFSPTGVLESGQGQ